MASSPTALGHAARRDSTTCATPPTRLPYRASREARRSGDTEEGALSLPSPLILVVDDDTQRCDETCAHFAQLGYRLRRATRRESALAALTAPAPDLILIELDLRNRSYGWATVRVLRQDPLTAHIRILAIVPSDPMPEDLAADLAALHLPVVQRPVRLEQVAMAVQALLAP